MGHEIVPANSPAHRRLQNPSSPISPFRRNTSSVARDEPDLGWRALIHRHQFLLLMLGLLLFLCTIYLYFAITIGTGDSCAGLTGAQKEICNLSKDKTRRIGSRALLQQHGKDLDAMRDLAMQIRRRQGDSLVALSIGCAEVFGDVNMFVVYADCKILNGKNATSVESTSSLPHGLFDLVFLDFPNKAQDANRRLQQVLRLVRKGGRIVTRGLDNSDHIMLNSSWSLIGREDDRQIWRASRFVGRKDTFLKREASS